MSNYIDRDLNNLAFAHTLDPYMTGHKGSIAGGCWKNIINGEEIKDVDVYFHNETDFNEAVE